MRGSLLRKRKHEEILASEDEEEASNNGYNTEDDAIGEFIRAMERRKRQKRERRKARRVTFSLPSSPAPSSSSEDDEEDVVVPAAAPSMLERVMMLPLSYVTGDSGKFEDRLKAILHDRMSPEMFKNRLDSSSIVDGSQVDEYCVFVRYPDSLSVDDLTAVSRIRNVSWITIDKVSEDDEETGKFCLKITVCQNPESAQAVQTSFLRYESYRVNKRMNRAPVPSLVVDDKKENTAHYIESCVTLDKTGGPPPSRASDSGGFHLFVQTPLTYSALDRLSRFPLFSQIEVCAVPGSRQVCIRIELVDV